MWSGCVSFGVVTLQHRDYMHHVIVYSTMHVVLCLVYLYRGVHALQPMNVCYKVLEQPALIIVSAVFEAALPGAAAAAWWHCFWSAHPHCQE